MKKMISIIMIILSTFFVGCKQEIPQTTSVYSDATENSIASQFQPIVSTDTGYYILSFPLLYYMEQDSSQPIPLCNQPNCMHNDSSCNAWIQGIDLLLLYENKLYYTTPKGLETAFMSIGLDGEVRKELFSIPIGEFCSEILIHRGKVYYVRYKEASQESCLCCFDLESNIEEQLYTEKASLEPFFAAGNQLFLNRMYTDEKQTYHADSLCWDIEKKGMSTFVLEHIDQKTEYSLFYGFDKQLYGIACEEMAEISGEVELFVCNLDGTGRKALGMLPRDIKAMDQKHVYYKDGTELVILDKEGNELHREPIVLKEDVDSTMLFPLNINCTGTDRIFLYAYSVCGEEMAEVMLSLDWKKDGGWKPIHFLNVLNRTTGD